MDSLRDQYRKYLKNLTTKSGKSTSIKIANADEISFVRPYLRERETVTNLEFDKKARRMRKSCNNQSVNMMVKRNNRSGLLQVQNVSSQIRVSEGH
jgi:predicted ATPase